MDCLYKKGVAARNVKAIGITRENRTLGASSKMKKSDRETFGFRSDGVVYFCKWNDNSVVNIGTNFLPHLSIENVKRRVKNEPDAHITQPQLIKQYNNGMEGGKLKLFRFNLFSVLQFIP